MDRLNAPRRKTIIVFETARAYMQTVVHSSSSIRPDSLPAGLPKCLCSVLRRPRSIESEPPTKPVWPLHFRPNRSDLGGHNLGWLAVLGANPPVRPLGKIVPRRRDKIRFACRAVAAVARSQRWWWRGTLCLEWFEESPIIMARAKMNKGSGSSSSSSSSSSTIISKRRSAMQACEWE